MRKTVKWEIVFLVFVFSITFFGSIQLSSAKDTVITVATGSFSDTMDPHSDFNAVSYSIERHMFDPLVWLTAEEGKIEISPWLAESWEMLNEKSCKFRLRKGIFFHNGEPFNASSVKFSLERFRNPKLKSPKKFLYTPIDHVDVVDESTAIVQFSTPFAPFLNILSMTMMLPPGAANDFDKFATNPVGTGPFTFREFVPGSSVEMVANEKYWQGRPKVDKVVFRMIKSDVTRIAALEAGEVDLITNLPPVEVERLKGKSDLEVRVEDSTRCTYIVMNAAKIDAFKDVRVRKALNYAIDKESLVKHMLYGYGRVMTSPTSRNLAFHKENLVPYRYDLSKAKDLMAQAGYANGIPGKLVLGTSWGRYLKDKELAEAVSGMLEKIGVKTEILAMEWAPFRDERDKGKESKFDLMLAAYGVNDLEPDFVQRRLFYAPEKTYLVKMGLSNETVDKNVEQALQTFDPDKLKKLYGDNQEYVWNNAWMLFIWEEPQLIGLNKRLKGFKGHPDEFVFVMNCWK